MIVTPAVEADLIWEMLIMEVEEECGFRQALYKLLDNPRELSEAIYKLDYRRAQFRSKDVFEADYIANREYWVKGASLDTEEYGKFLDKFHKQLRSL